MAQSALIPSQVWDQDDTAPRSVDVLSQVAHFLDQLGYTTTFNALLKEAQANGITVDIAEWERGLTTIKTASTLMDLWEEWKEEHGSFPTLPEGSPVKKGGKKIEVDLVRETIEASSSEDSDNESSEDEDEETEGKAAGVVDDEAESTSDDSSEEESEADNSSDEDADDSNAQTGVKRKRVLTPESSSEEESDSDSESDASSSDESDAPAAKRVKTTDTADSSDSSSESSSDSDSESAVGGVDVDSSDDSSSGSSSDEVDSEDDSSSDSDSDSDSDSSSAEASDDEKSDSSASPPPKKKTKITVAPPPLKSDMSSASSSSATLDEHPPPPSKANKKSKKNKAAPTSAAAPAEDLLVPAPAVAQNEGMHPDRLARLPATTENVKQLKKEAVPFSRIPADTKVDPRFASNDYVPYDYAQKAYQDLSVTKGKGFTKEKNKKKRGEQVPDRPSSSSSWETVVSEAAKQREKKRRRVERNRECRRQGRRLNAYFAKLPDPDPFDMLEKLENPYGLKDDTFDFMSGCGFNPMSGGWGGAYRGGAIDLAPKGIKFDD